MVMTKIGTVKSGHLVSHWDCLRWLRDDVANVEGVAGGAWSSPRLLIDEFV